MKSKPGTYALVLKSLTGTDTQIGRWGHLTIEPGYYIYVGSAFGPGGVSARVLRHCRETKSKSRHWHIDYLREFVTPIAAWYSYEPDRLEHQWAETLTGMPDMAPIKGFGCSDCTCQAHLFFTEIEPNLARFKRAMGGSVESWLYLAAG